jgi:thiamine pyrophosphate-dependent acetolactate synthase large subunit-like protein
MIEVAEMLKVFQEHRGDAIVVPGQAGRHWTTISTRPELDVPLIPYPAMGGGASFAFGLALAQPERKVVVFDSEGALVMYLGILTTVAEQQPKNLYHFLLDNECYATTGGQPVPNAKATRYDALARDVGYASTFAFDRLEGFATSIGRILAAPAPAFVALKVRPEIQNVPVAERKRWATRTREQVRDDLKRALVIAGGR